MSSHRLTVLLKTLSAERYRVEEFSARLRGEHRKKALKRFKKGTTRVLISSDVFSRGIDVEDIDVVINYDVPLNERLLVHRIGRTARCGKRGTALSLVTAHEKEKLREQYDKTDYVGDFHETVFADSGNINDKLLYQEALQKLKETLQIKSRKWKKGITSKGAKT